MNSDQLVLLGQQIIMAVSQNIIELSHVQPLGKETGQIGAGGDYTKNADSEAERLIIENLETFICEYPHLKIVILSEEIGLREIGNAKAQEGVFVIIDPIDGSNNMRAWRTPSPFVSISLAMGSLAELAQLDGLSSVDTALVGDIFNSRIYIAQKGKGARVIGFGKINTSPEQEVEKSIVGIDIDGSTDQKEVLLQRINPLLKSIKCQRRLGSSILDYMKVAVGEYDAFLTIQNRMKISDIAAAKLIIEESGGVFDIVDKKFNFCLFKEILNSKDNSFLKKYKFNVIASGNEYLHKKILGKIQ